jgi:hypothetical protein
MSIKVRSLGSFTSAARGILITGGTNATPIVATVTAGHGMKTDDRIGIVGVTTLTSMDGDWSLDAVGATAATLRGSVGNGAFAGTAVVAVLCDRTPFNKGHAAIVMLGNTPGQAVFVGTLVIEGADSMDSTLANFQYTNSSGVATNGFADKVPSGEAAIPAATAGIGWELEVALSKYMTARCSAYTSGGANARIAA